MSLTFLRDPDLTPERRDEIVRLWTEVSTAGGAVGFVPPVTLDEVRAVADVQLDATARGALRLLTAYEDGRLAGTVFLKLNTHRLMQHWCTFVTVMIDPALQGGGRGDQMLREAIRMARDLGFLAVQLDCRGGTGVDAFYARFGFKEVGRVPEMIHMGGGEYRDSIAMWLPLN
ncbi:GNAT family N-acetyltransferase [Streptomyces sp. RB6PN25]|uniref:GNAT family N-acetyltransferase n=1 Tax=Streptomyces humicola TaxID=2953240 RepID=A0ABT1PU93_9ACTN|nr:GNAT family N-acetyltransferase [Streptomyces humicola]